MPGFKVPSATYRLQFSSHFRFADAVDVVLYLKQLGISDVYASPIFKARTGSLHGYDIVNPNQTNPELGSEPEFELMLQKIQNQNLGLLLDIVPNHMAANPENPFWTDILEKGLSSRYADFFDIEWPSRDGIISNKVILPILAKPYGQSLEDQDISLEINDLGLFIRYLETRLPVSVKAYALVLSYRLDFLEAAGKVNSSDLQKFKQILADIEKLSSLPEGGKLIDRNFDVDGIKERLTALIESSPEVKAFLQENVALFNGEKGNAASFDHLDELLNEQVYLLSFWRTGREELNFRRFFDINNLVGVRVELPEVLEATHALIFRLVREGKVSGLRIDHIDGLYNPQKYIHDLRRHLGRFYIIVEKILSGDEFLPGDWLACGTTGYDFSREVNNVFVNRQGISKLDEHYTKMIGNSKKFAIVVVEKKKQVIEDLFFSEVHSLGYQLHRLASQDRYARDLSELDLTQALIEVTAALPVYRTYINSFEISPIDRQNLVAALQRAQSLNPNLEESALNFLRRVLLLEFTPNFRQEQKQAWLRWTMKWQQLTGPATAKGLEDTALYTYNRLMSLNVIGAPVQSEPNWSIDWFHRFNLSRQGHWPLTLNATMTHDSKRSEDVSARINVLSEMPQPWIRHLAYWRRCNYPQRQNLEGQVVPDPNIEELLYQTLVGAWPFSAEEIPQFKERFKAYMLKSVREAKALTDWVRPNGKYEKALLTFIDLILEESEQNEFLLDFVPFQKQIAFYGALNSLGQVLLKITSPGIPDFYQGTELWNLSLVDPDNRRPVDFDLCKKLLNEIEAQAQQNKPNLSEDILKHWQDGRIKLYITYIALNFRRENAALFRGAYLPIYAEGRRKENVIAFYRQLEDKWILVVVPRLSTNLVEVWDYPLEKRIWKNEGLVLPAGAPIEWKNIFTDETVDASEGKRLLLLSEVFKTFPVALLTSA